MKSSINIVIMLRRYRKSLLLFSCAPYKNLLSLYSAFRIRGRTKINSVFVEERKYEVPFGTVLLCIVQYIAMGPFDDASVLVTNAKFP